MSRQFYLDLAAVGRRLPVATHLVLHQHPDPEEILRDGERLAAVMAETADRFGSPIALPIMDLTLEKEFLLGALGLGGSEPAKFHFDGAPPPDAALAIHDADITASPRIRANLDALSRIDREGRLVPVGMSIGPFSLLTKLISDPIAGIYLSGAGVGAAEDPAVAQLESLRVLAELVVAVSIRAQIAAGAKAIFLCEPAANLVYFSPNQLRAGSPVFDEFVIRPNLRLKAILDKARVDLILHDCGELIPEMVEAFRPLRPVMISLGSPVKLWEIERHVDRDVVIYGNLPTKKFYSDTEVPLDGVLTMANEIAERLSASGHPFIIGSECDVLAMPGYEMAIMAKVARFCGELSDEPDVAHRGGHRH